MQTASYALKKGMTDISENYLNCGSREMTQLLSDVRLPQFYRVKQKFDGSHMTDEMIVSVLKGELREVLTVRKQAENSGLCGMRIAVTAGSRGVANIALILKTIVSFLKENSAVPFIIPAMGSHGGATAEGQKNLLAGYGITEKSMGCPIESSMDVKKIGKTADGRDVFIDRLAAEADGIIVVGRIKPHTAFRGPYQSGLMKMMAIGLGKQYGASVCHAEGFQRMGYNVRTFGSAVIKHANILCGVGIVENAFDETRKIRVLPKEDIERVEPELLKEAEQHMPRILWPSCDVLVVDEIGKNFSGDGMDPNVTGSFATPYADGGIRAERICLLDLSPETHGNGMGTGMASVITRRIFNQLDVNTMYINAMTCKNLNGSRIPCVMINDKEAIQFCLKTCVQADRRRPKILRICNSQFVEYLWVSEALAEELPETAEIISGPSPLPFDAEGNLTDRLPRQRGQRFQ